MKDAARMRYAHGLVIGKFYPPHAAIGTWSTRPRRPARG